MLRKLLHGLLKPKNAALEHRDHCPLQKEAEKRVLNGLTAIMEHFNEHSRYEGMTYAGIRDLLSEMDYEIACRTEIRRMQREGLNWTAMAKTLNEKGAPLPAGQGRGKWTELKIKALMA